MKSLMTKIAVVTFVSVFGLTWGTEQNLAKAESLQKVMIRVSADIPPPPMPTSVAMEWFKKKVVRFVYTTLARFIRILTP